MKENKLNRITEFADAEFLSFLYAERERENSLNKYQGWNIWALVGALVTVVCASYGILKENSYLICSRQVAYMVSCMLAFVLLVYPYIQISTFFLRPRRGIDDKKIRTLKNIIPYYYMGLSTAVAGSLSTIIPLMDSESPWNVVSCSWAILLASYLFAWVSAFINKDKIVNPRLSDMAFVGIWMHSAMIGQWCGLLNVVVVFSFKQVEMPIIGDANFEMAICIFSLTLLAFLLLFVYMKERKSNNMDILIDEYLYKDATKEDIFRTLRVRRMGHTALESCGKELMGLRRSLDAYEKNMAVMEDINKAISNKSLDISKMNKYVDEIQGVLSYFSGFDKHFSRMTQKLDQIGKQIPALKLDDEYSNLVALAGMMVKKEKELSNYANEVSDKLRGYADPYLCQKYGGICMTKCEHRHDQPPLLLKLAQKYMVLVNKIRAFCMKYCSKCE